MSARHTWAKALCLLGAALLLAALPASGQTTMLRKRVVVLPVRSSQRDIQTLAIILATEQALPRRLNPVSILSVTGPEEFLRECAENKLPIGSLGRELAAARKLGFTHALAITVSTAFPRFEAQVSIYDTSVDRPEVIQNILLAGNTLDLLGFEAALAHKIAVQLGASDTANLRELTRRSPTMSNPAYLAYYEGLAYLRSRKYDEALAKFQKAQELDPQFRDPRAKQGETYREKAGVLMDTNPDEALKLLDQAIAILQGLGEYRAEAEAYVLQRDIYKAKGDKNNLREATHNAARCYLLIGYPELADGLLLDLVANDLDDAETHYIRGLAWLRRRVETQRPNEMALNEFTAAIERDEMHAEARYQRALIFKERARDDAARGEEELANQEFDSAVKDLIVATTVNPKWWQAWYELGEVVRLRGNPRDALDYYNQALDVLGQDARPIDKTLCLHGKAKALRAAGALEEAAAVLEQAINTTPEHLPPWFELIMVYTELANYDDARKWLAKAREQFSAPKEAAAGGPTFLQVQFNRLERVIAEHEKKKAGEELPRAHFDPTNPYRFGGRHEIRRPGQKEGEK